MELIGNIDSAVAERFKCYLIDKFSSESQIIVDLKQVERSYFSFLQVLVSAYQFAQKNQKNIHFILPETLKTDLRDLNLDFIIPNE